MSRPAIVKLVACAVLVVFSTNASANNCYRLTTSVDLTLNGSTHSARANGSVTCTNSNGDLEWDLGSGFDGNIRIHQVNPATDFSSEFHQYGQWIGSIGAPADYTVKTCYQSFISASSAFITGSAQSNEQCTPDPPPPSSGGGGPSGGPDPGGGGYNEDMPCFPGIDAWCSPIVISLENGDCQLTGKNAPVLFDIRGDGHPLLMGWTAAGADEAFLWLDRNNNHTVTSGAELFGNFTLLKNGLTAKNGFEALSELDANHDGILDERDPIWPELLLWRDLNHNGISEPDEISTLDSSGVTAIDLQYHWTGRHDQWGNDFRYQSKISMRNRAGRAVRHQPVYDIFFVSVAK